MASRNRIPWKLKRGIYEAAEWGEVEVTTGDTFTVDTLSTATGAIYEAVLLQMTNGVAVTCTHAEVSPNGNRVTAGTAGGAVTNMKCIYLVYGVKA
jgi:hypothetical protein